MEIKPTSKAERQLAELVVTLQKALLQLSQRVEVDSVMLSVLLDELENPAATLENWKAKVSSYYPAQATSLLGDARMNQSVEELKGRVSLWTRALEARVHAQHRGQ